MTLLAVRQPGGLRMLPLFGLGSAPMWLAPWASLLLTSVLIPKASFVGHLAGILAGYVVASGALGWLGPPGAGCLLLGALAAVAAQAARSGQLGGVPGLAGLSRLASYLPLPGGGSGSDVEAGASSGSGGTGGGGTRIVGGQVVRGR